MVKVSEGFASLSIGVRALVSSLYPRTTAEVLRMEADAMGICYLFNIKGDRNIRCVKTLINDIAIHNIASPREVAALMKASPGCGFNEAVEYARRVSEAETALG